MPIVSPDSHPTANRLLNALPPDLLGRLRPHLTTVDLPLRQSLYQVGQRIPAAFFPEAGVISMVTTLEDGLQAEVGIVGREGMLGIPLLFGAETPFVDGMVQVAGRALRLDAGTFRRELDGSPPLRALLLRYGEAQQAQVSQTAACNGRHGLEQRLARWLLEAHDRVDDDTLALTQEFIATMLGVHRPSVTVTAGILQRAGLIRYGAGRVTVVDRPGLEASACECYGAVRRRFEELLGFSPRSPRGAVTDGGAHDGAPCGTMSGT